MIEMATFYLQVKYNKPPSFLFTLLCSFCKINVGTQLVLKYEFYRKSKDFFLNYIFLSVCRYRS